MARWMVTGIRAGNGGAFFGSAVPEILAHPSRVCHPAKARQGSGGLPTTGVGSGYDWRRDGPVKERPFSGRCSGGAQGAHGGPVDVRLTVIAMADSEVDGRSTRPAHGYPLRHGSALRAPHLGPLARAPDAAKARQ